MLRAILELCRISNLPTVWTNVTAAWVFIAMGDLWHLELLWLLIGASLVYCAGMILNDACDATWDRDNRPERPIPSGRISLRTAWALGIGGLLGGYALMVLAGGAGPGITAALVGAIVLYDVYHKPWAGSVIVMGLCRSLLFVVAGFAAENLVNRPDDLLTNMMLLAGLAEGAYVVALTLTARAEGQRSVMGQKVLAMLLLMLPVVWAVLEGVIILWAIMEDDGHPGVEFSLLAVVGFFVPVAAFIGWTCHALYQMRKGGPAIGQAVGLLLAGIPLVDAMVISAQIPALALGFCCLPPLLRYWQRWVAAT